MARIIPWTKIEDEILINNYENNYSFVILNIKRSKKAIYRRARKLNLKIKKKIKYGDNLIDVIKSSKSIGEIIDKIGLRKAGGNYLSIKRFIKLKNIDVSHFETQSERAKRSNTLFNKKPIGDYLVNGRECGSSLKNRLYKEGLLNPICSICSQNENWNGVKISLILDHINGNHFDNRIENLRIVCPNCNAGLNTFAGRNKKQKGKLG